MTRWTSLGPRPSQAGSSPPSGAAGRRVLDTLILAFHEDPLYRWLVPDQRVRPLALREMFKLTLELGSRCGTLDTGRTRRSVAVWAPPEVQLLDDPQPFVELLARWAPMRTDEAVAAMAACASKQPAGTAVLHLLAVHPADQGAGCARSLLLPRLRDLDAAGHGVYLETSNPANVSFYARFGFDEIADTQVSDGGPCIFSLLRPAGGSRDETALSSTER